MLVLINFMISGNAFWDNLPGNVSLRIYSQKLDAKFTKMMEAKSRGFSTWPGVLGEFLLNLCVLCTLSIM